MVVPAGAAPGVSRPGANRALCTTHDVQLLQLSQGITNSTNIKLINEFFTVANKNFIQGNGLRPLCLVSIRAVCECSKIITTLSDFFLRFFNSILMKISDRGAN